MVLDLRFMQMVLDKILQITGGRGAGFATWILQVLEASFYFLFSIGMIIALSISVPWIYAAVVYVIQFFVPGT